MKNLITNETHKRQVEAVIDNEELEEIIAAAVAKAANVNLSRRNIACTVNIRVHAPTGKEGQRYTATVSIVEDMLPMVEVPAA